MAYILSNKIYTFAPIKKGKHSRNKMKTKRVASKMIVAILMCSYSALNAQYHLQLLENPANINYDNIVNQTEAYYATHYNGPGSGYKQFGRWKTDYKFKLDANRNVTNYNQIISRNYNTWANVNQPLSVNGNWQFIGPVATSSNLQNINGVGRINCIAIDPSNSNIIYVGTPAGGMWRSSNGGSTWSILTDSYSANIGASSIAIDPLSSPTNRTIYIATGDLQGFGASTNVGILKSTNNGTTWINTGNLVSELSSYVICYKLIVNPVNSNILLAATNIGVYRSTNSGSSWVSCPSIDGKFIVDIELNTSNPNIVYCATKKGEVYMASDGGYTWLLLSNGSSGLPVLGTPAIGVPCIAVTKANSNYIYVLFSDSYTANGKFTGLYLSTNGGATFSLISNTPNIMGKELDGTDIAGNVNNNYNARAISISPNDATQVYVGCFNVWKSTNSGQNWTRISNSNAPRSNSTFLHADIQHFAFSNDGNTLYCANDGGIFKSTNGGSTWTDLSAGLAITAVTSFGLDITKNNQFIFGSQDNGTYYLNGNVLNSIFGGDGQRCFIDPYTTPSNLYATATYGVTVRIPSNNLLAPTYIPQTTYTIWAWPFFIDPNNHLNIFAAQNIFWKSINNGSSWIDYSGGNIGGSASSCDNAIIAQTNSNIVYASKNNTVYKSINGGINWQALTISIAPSGWGLTKIAVSSENENEVWVIGQNVSPIGPLIFYSKDGGMNWTTKTTNGLPSITPSAIVHQKGSPNRIYIGMDKGIYYLDEGALSWVNFSTGIPFAKITQLEIDYVGNKIVASTFGRGLWSSDIPTCYTAASTLNIPSSTTWTTPVNSLQSINIPSGVTLTIKSTVYMPANAKIIVNPGGTLVVDGGKITSACNSLWKGIEVWGNSSQRQLANLQGTVRIINNGSIQYSNIAITTCKKDASGNIDWNYTGGIIQCTNALFRNNKKSVEFLFYENKNPFGTPTNNISYFNTCTFETISKLPGGVLPNAHVSMYAVRGISFGACKFRNTALQDYTPNQRGVGLISADAGYSVSSVCLDQWICQPQPCPCSNLALCSFDGLTDGINASFSASSLRAVSVNTTIFNNVQHGIQCIGGAYGSFTGNTFSNIPIAQSVAQGNETYGIYMNGATNFTISANNTFTGFGTQSSTTNNYGVIVSNSLNTASDVSFNSYANLYAGTQTQFNNGSGSTGLKISCNAYNLGFRYAWAINPQSAGYTIANQGEGCISSVKQAGNTWNYSSTLSNNQINSTIPFQYYAGNGAGMQPSYVSTIVGNNFCTPSATNPNTCIVSSGGGGFLSTSNSGTSKYSNTKLPVGSNPTNATSDTSEGANLIERNNMVRHLLSVDSTDAALALLEADNSPAAKKIVVGEYLTRRNTLKAKSALNQLPIATSDDNDFFDYYKLLSGIISTGKNIYLMDKAQENRFTQLASTNSAISYNAKVALMFAKNKKYAFTIERFDEKNGAALKQAQATVSVNADSNEAVLDDNTPNPFNENTIINSFVPIGASTAHLVVCDYLGKLSGKYNLQTGFNTTEITGSGLAGVYFYSLVIDGNKVATKKMVVVH